MPSLSLTAAQLEEMRQGKRRLHSGLRISTDEQAAEYIAERGFVPLAPLPHLALPSLSEADIREPWPGYDISDGAWHWKETLPAAKLCAYQKLFRNRGIFISWRLFPSFYLLYGPQDSYEENYQAGALERMAYRVLQIIEKEGPLSSRDLWRKARWEFGGNRTRFEGVLTALQHGFYITVAGGSLEGWSLHYWDLVERQVPQGLLDKLPSLQEARAALLLQFIENMVVCSLAEMRALFRWSPSEIEATLQRLAQAGRLYDQVVVEGRRERLWAVT